MTAEELLEKAARALQFRYGEPKPVVTPTDDARIVLRLALEEALAAVAGETLDTEVDDSDTAYNVAINHAIAAIRKLIPQEPSHDQ